MCSTSPRWSRRSAGSSAREITGRDGRFDDRRRHSPSALLFGYVANYIYDGDAPLAERRAQALAIDQAQLRELLGEAELRELLDADALAEIERQLQHLDPDHHARSVDGVHDLLLRLGDLTTDEIAARSRIDAERRRRPAATRAARSRSTSVARRGWCRSSTPRRYRDALGVPLPVGLPESLLAPAPQATQDLARRYARTHGPFTTLEFAARYALGRATAESILKELASSGRLLEGEFRPGGSGREWCDPDVLQSIRRRSLARLRKQVEPVEPASSGACSTSWQGVSRPRAGARRVARCDREPSGRATARVDFRIGDPRGSSAGIQPRRPRCADGGGRSDVVRPRAARRSRWTARALPHRPLAAVASRPAAPPDFVCPRARDCRSPRIAGRLVLCRAARGRRRWLSWRNGGRDLGSRVERSPDQRHVPCAARIHAAARAPASARPAAPRSFRSRRVGAARPPKDAGRSIQDRADATVSPTEWSTATAQQLLSRYGVLTREVAGAEGIAGGFSAVYDVLKAMEDAGRIRRGYFVGGVGATQFALPAALELMRSFKDPPEDPETVVLAATDPANPYGTMLKWPACRQPANGRRTRTNTDRRIARRPRQRRARRRTSPAAAGSSSSSCRKTNRRDRSSAGRSRHGSRDWRADRGRTRRPAGLGNQRHPGGRSSARAVSDRRRVQRVGHGLPDAGCVCHRQHRQLADSASSSLYHDRPPRRGERAMPEGDTIFRAARTLHRALAGKPVTAFESDLPALNRIHDDAPMTGRTIERVTRSRQHLLMHFSGDLVLRTHMRMNGSWHIYRRASDGSVPGATCASSSSTATSRRSVSTSLLPNSHRHAS